MELVLQQHWFDGVLDQYELFDIVSKRYALVSIGLVLFNGLIWENKLFYGTRPIWIHSYWFLKTRTTKNLY